MKNRSMSSLCLVGAALSFLVPSAAWSQQQAGADAGEDASGPSTSQPTSSGVATPMYFRPAPGEDINGYLPSSSRPITGDTEDSFDLNQRSDGGAVILRGGGAEEAYGDIAEPGDGASGIQKVQRKPVPEFHMVKKGDTLWDISQEYYDSPRDWPRLWSMNPQVDNPHWIYPGDQLRTGGNGTAAGESPAFAEDNSAGRGGFVGRERSVPQGTVFLRDQGYLGDPDKDVWGEVVGAHKEVMMLGKGDMVYLLLEDDAKPRVGQRLTVFHEVRVPHNVPGARKPPGELVKVYGTVRVDAFDSETHVAKGMLIESLDVVERGAKVGPVGRRFDVVSPKEADVDLEARILTSVYPNVFFAQNQVVFIDKGSEDGLVPGNRLRAVRHGDTWRRQLKSASRHTRLRVLLDDPSYAPTEMTPLHGDDDDFPDEVVGEVIVLRTEEYSAVCLVTESSRALESGEKLVVVSGY